MPDDMFRLPFWEGYTVTSHWLWQSRRRVSDFDYLTQNMATLKHVLSPDDLLELEDMLEAHPTQGLRYPAAAMQAYNLTS